MTADYARAALEWLDGISVEECASKQAEFESRQASAAPSSPKPYQMAGGVAIIPVSGLMTKKPTSASYFFGGTSTLRTRQQLNQAKQDEDVDQVLMVFETPGGQVEGLPELAATVRAVDSLKPVHAYVEDGCFSAGYFIASQCRSVSVNKTGRVGSLGTMQYALDDSAAYAMQGLKAHVFTLAPFKANGYEGIPLSDEFKAERMKTVSVFHESFVEHVAMGRGMEEDQARALFTGKTFFADEALDLGLVDCVCSFEECLETVSAGLTPGWEKTMDATTQENAARSIGMSILSAIGFGKDKSAAGGHPGQAAAALTEPNVIVVKGAETSSAPDTEALRKLEEANATIKKLQADALADRVAKSLEEAQSKTDPAAHGVIKEAYELAASHGEPMVEALDKVFGVFPGAAAAKPEIPDDAEAVDADTKKPKTTSRKRKDELLRNAGVNPAKETK